MRLFIYEELDRGIMCTNSWVSIIKRANPFYRDGWSMRLIIPLYKLDWYDDIERREKKWCRQYPSIFFFGNGFVGQRVFWGWIKAEELGL